MSAEQFPVRNRWTNAVQFTAEISVTPDMLPSVKLGLAIRWGVKNGADLRGANLSDADLRDAFLRDANLSDANLRGAVLSDANLRGAVLRGAFLRDADLSGADLRGAFLRGANLSDADLRDADLRGANLSDANLRGAVLRGAFLRDADLSGADLRGANLRGAKDADYAIAQTRILPAGDLIGWKKCENGVIVKLRIPEDAPRSHAFGRKCRAKFADVLEIIGADEARSSHDRSFIYRTGGRVEALNWSDNWQDECAGGVHFFITKIEAENY